MLIFRLLSFSLLFDEAERFGNQNQFSEIKAWTWPEISSEVKTKCWKFHWRTDFICSAFLSIRHHMKSLNEAFSSACSLKKRIHTQFQIAIAVDLILCEEFLELFMQFNALDIRYGTKWIDLDTFLQFSKKTKGRQGIIIECTYGLKIVFKHFHVMILSEYRRIHSSTRDLSEPWRYRRAVVKSFKIFNDLSTNQIKRFHGARLTSSKYFYGCKTIFFLI